MDAIYGNAVNNTKDFFKKKPSLEYIQTIVNGYNDCNLDLNYLKKRISNIMFLTLGTMRKRQR